MRRWPCQLRGNAAPLSGRAAAGLPFHGTSEEQVALLLLWARTPRTAAPSVCPLASAGVPPGSGCIVPLRDAALTDSGATMAAAAADLLLALGGRTKEEAPTCAPARRPLDGMRPSLGAPRRRGAAGCPRPIMRPPPASTCCCREDAGGAAGRPLLRATNARWLQPQRKHGSPPHAHFVQRPKIEPRKRRNGKQCAKTTTTAQGERNRNGLW